LTTLQERPLAPLVGPTTLVVDDASRIRRLIRRILEPEGHRVIDAATVATAVTAFDSATDAVDLLITDYSMPDGDGLSLARTLAARSSRLRIIVMSGSYDVEISSDIGNVTRFLAKPFDAEQLRACVNGVLCS
jgi:DNA-binding NtrC family response regulator